MTTPAPDVFLADCPARAALDLIADTWSVVVLVGLAHDPRRHTWLLDRAGDPGVPSRTPSWTRDR